MRSNLSGPGRFFPKPFERPGLFGTFALAMLALFMTANGAVAATLATDKGDYYPGEFVVFSGSGWQPGETVNIQIFETSVEPIFDEGSASGVADTNGNISDIRFEVLPSFLGQGFIAYAVGASSG